MIGRHEHLFASIRELEPLIRAHQVSADRLGCIPDAVMDAFFERDLFRILLPSELGGGGVDLLTGMLLVEQVSAVVLGEQIARPGATVSCPATNRVSRLSRIVFVT